MDISPEKDAKQRAEVLINAVMPYAEQMLIEQEEFLPYAGVMNRAGEIQLVHFTYEENEQPSAKELLESGSAALHEGANAGEYSTTARVINASVVQPDMQEVDAVTVLLDDMDGHSIEVFFPYTILEGRVDFGTAFAQHGSSSIFGLRQNG